MRTGSEGPRLKAALNSTKHTRTRARARARTHTHTHGHIYILPAVHNLRQSTWMFRLSISMIYEDKILFMDVYTSSNVLRNSINELNNKAEDQLDAPITIYWSSNYLNMFRAIHCPSSGAQDCDSVWYNVVGRRPGLRPTTIWGHYTTRCHSLALLKMGNELPETCWDNLKINKLLLLHLVGPLLYLFRWCAAKHISSWIISTQNMWDEMKALSL